MCVVLQVRPVVKRAIGDLADALKGVGPATASLLLAATFPTLFPFFADEV